MKLKWIVRFIALLIAYPLSAQEHMEFVPSPFRSPDQNRTLLDVVDLRMMFPLGYTLQPGRAEDGIATRKGVEEYRLYLKRDPEGSEHRIELAIIPGTMGGYEFIIHGQTRTPDGQMTTNKDLKEIRNRFNERIQEVGDVEYVSHRLGHIQSDRALALLRTLGYTAVNLEDLTAGAPDDRRQSESRRGEPKQETDQAILTQVWSKGYKLPMIILISGADKTSLMETPAGDRGAPRAGARENELASTPQLGGKHLHGITAGDPQERLLIVYHRKNPEALQQLLNLIEEKIDLPAQQIIVEALIVEVNTTQLRDLGIEFSSGEGRVSGNFTRSDFVEPPKTQKGEAEVKSSSSGRENTPPGADLPFTFVYDASQNAMGFLKARLKALVQTGDAEILSSPSVLVLNDRQARIQVVQQIPVANVTSTSQITKSSVQYFPVGIVLNLRPRINADGTEVTMQIETIISSIAQLTQVGGEGAGSLITLAPTVDNRQVESYIRVANGSPFIIGGLLSNDQTKTIIGIPFLSRIPGLGALFRRERVNHEQREVIVVITPHIVPQEEKGFSYLIPKDADLFDRFDTRLFRNTYRVRDDDVWDLAFIRQNSEMKDLVEAIRGFTRQTKGALYSSEEPFQTLLTGNIPGEEAIVKRMIWEIIRKLDYGKEIDLSQVSLFVHASDTAIGGAFDEIKLDQILAGVIDAPERAVLLTYNTRPDPDSEQLFQMPIALVRDTTALSTSRKELLWKTNQYDEQGHPLQFAIVLADRADVERLQEVLVLKRLLEMNSILPQTLQAFRPGIQVLFPTRAEMRRNHLIDGEVARLFYETEFYFQTFNRVYSKAVEKAENILLESEE